MSGTPFPQHIIARKRDGHELTKDEISAFVRGATDGSWADYQLSALLMAIFWRGMSNQETALYTEAMMHSGVVADLSHVRLAKANCDRLAGALQTAWKLGVDKNATSKVKRPPRLSRRLT